MPTSNLRHGQGNLSSKVLKKFGEELKLIQLLNHTLFLSRKKTKTVFKLYITCTMDGRMVSIKVDKFTSEVWRGPGCCLRKTRTLLTDEGEESARKRSCKTLQVTPWPTVPRLLITWRGECQYMHIAVAYTVKLYSSKETEKIRASAARSVHTFCMQTFITFMKCTYRKSRLIRFGLVLCTSLKIALAWGRKRKNCCN